MNVPEFTGERYIPGQGGAEIAYEHMHRYLFAARWARGKRVLDLATGAGYGASLLARCARFVYAMDIDERAIRFARSAWSSPNLAFFKGDATRMSLRSESVDLAIAMEVLEHLADQEGLVREIARVCSPDGIALISTPNKAAYSDERNYSNPFHVHEFYREEFLSLVGRHFSCVQLLFQHVRAGSLITSDATDERLHEIITKPTPDSGARVVEPMYFLAICGHSDFVKNMPAASAYLDLTDSLLLEWERRLREAIREICELNNEINKLGDWGKNLEDTVKQRDQTLRQAIDRYEAELGARDQAIGALQEQMRHEIDLRDETIGALQEQMRHEIVLRDQIIGERDGYIQRLRDEFDDRGRWAVSLEKRVADRDALLRQTNETLDKTDAELHRVGDQLAQIRHHRLYRILCRLGLLPR